MTLCLCKPSPEHNRASDKSNAYDQTFLHNYSPPFLPYLK